MLVTILDVDGVLNNSAFLARNGNRVSVMDPSNVRELVRIISETGCSVVISSAWRVGQWTDDGLNRKGDIASCLIEAGGEMVLDHVVGVTPSILGAIVWDEPEPAASGASVTRGDEIAAWLAEHPEVTSFVILDDLGSDRPAELHEDVAPFGDRLVLTNMLGEGLNRERADEAIRLLKDPKAIANNEHAMDAPPLKIVAKEQPTDDFIIVHFSDGRRATINHDEGISGVRFGDNWLEFAVGDGSNQTWELEGSGLRRVT